ncbi:MAG: hypothetical protein NTW03_11655, partial [Verrucomicrobia bacterium]|nr:hypothetical protein [Verrucomicrobiota bacterium]
MIKAGWKPALRLGCGSAALGHYPVKSFRSEKILIWKSGTQEPTFFSLPDFLILRNTHFLRDA